MRFKSIFVHEKGIESQFLVLTMYCSSVLVILSLFSLAAAEVFSHGKIVTCITAFEAVLDLAGYDFRYNATNWHLCTHLLLIDDHIYVKGGSKHSLLPQHKQSHIILNYIHLFIQFLVRFIHFAMERCIRRRKNKRL